MKRQRTIFNRRVFLGIALLLMTVVMCGTASAKTFKLTAGFGLPADALPFIKAVRDYWAPEIKKRVESRTEHKIDWTLHFTGSVVKIPDEFEAVHDGILDVSMAFPIFENPALFIHNFSYFAPFGTSDIEQATKVNLKVYDMNPWLKNVFEKKHNQKWLATFTYESYDLITTFPVKSVDDLKGHKIAAAGPNLPWIKPVGCIPVQSIVTDAYTSLQTGVYEGWVLPASPILAFKIYEVANYFNWVGFGCISAASLTMNLDVWNSLPKGVQDIILEVGPDYSLNVASITKALHDSAAAKMKEKGVHFFTFPDEEKRAWMKSLGTMANDKAKEADKLGQPGTEIMKSYIAEMARSGHKWPMQWVIR